MKLNSLKSSIRLRASIFLCASISLTAEAATQPAAQAEPQSAAQAAPQPSAAKNDAPPGTLKVKTVLDDKNVELYSPRFIPKSDNLVIVRKAHEPDYHEAEAFSSKELEKGRDQKNTNPRWADPEITMISNDGSARKIIDYGWCPEPNARGNKIYYIHQLKPISGLRVLAENQKGNELCSYAITDGKKQLLVTPSLGYIDSPMPHPTEDKVAYEISDNTNGAYGGAVGLGVFEESSRKALTLLEPAKHFKLYDLVGPASWIQSNLVTLRKTPQEEGTWLADSYKWDILRLANGTQTAIYAREQPIKIHEKTLRVGTAPDGNIELIEDDKLIKLSIDGNLIESAPMPETRGLSSPNNKLEAILTEDDAVEVTVKATGRKYKQKLHGQVQTLQWSPDSKQLAAVVTKNKTKSGMDVFDRDSLMLISMPES